MPSSNQPNTTLYINNLNDKVNKEELRSQLLALFTTYGKIVDIIAAKTPKMRGQAFLVFNDLASATTAMRACEGMVFYDKPLRIDYAKSKSYATLKKEDPNFIPPTSANASAFVNVPNDKKRSREEDVIVTGAPAAKREKADDDDEEMEIDEEDEEVEVPEFTSASEPRPSSEPTPRLYCTNLPLEVTESVLSVLFQQHDGFQSLKVVPSPSPNAKGEQLKKAQVIFKSTASATSAKNALDGFLLKKDWVMSVAYI